MNTGETVNLSEEQERNADGTVTHIVSVPRELKELRHSINLALFNLANGCAQPVETATMDLISVRFKLTPRAQGYLTELLAQPEFQNNKRKVFQSALYWLDQ